MYKLFLASLTTLLFFSCGNNFSSDDFVQFERAELSVSAEQHAAVTVFIKKFEEMSANESASTRAKLIEFYAVATANNCEIGNFDIISQDEVDEYLVNIGHSSVRDFHNWAVDHSTLMLEIISNNPSWYDFDIVDELITQQFALIHGEENNCELRMYTAFSRETLHLGYEGNFYLDDLDLIAFGGAFNTFVRMQEIQESCKGTDSSK